MRLVYFDEAGIGDVAKEPFAVVAAVIVEGDKQWRAVEAHLRTLVDQYVQPNDQVGFVFHAKDIHHGARKMPRDRYARSTRIELLKELCHVPSKFDLHLVAAYVDRAAYAARNPTLSRKTLAVNAQTIAAISCTGAVEKVLRSEGSADEVAVLVFENNESARQTIKEIHNFLRTPAALSDATAAGWALESVLPFTRIIDTAHFANKDEASILQVADAIAFAISRQLNGRDEEGYAAPIEKRLIMRLREFGSK